MSEPGPSEEQPGESGAREAGLPTIRAAGPTGGAQPGSEERFAPGTLLAERYRIVGRLGRGGMGEVYRADDLKLGQSVALKFLPPSADESWIRRFHDEVRIAREVSHPNVCRTYDIGEVDGQFFISMEYVDGEDLSVLLRRIGRLPRDKAIEIARQLCAGLAAAHDKGVLHRDLKPANVMLDGRGKVRITDFGIAALAEQVGAQDTGAGTPFYMAPEQLEGQRATARSDIYSLGLVLYEVFTGREAFKADSLRQLKQLRRSSVISTPSTLVEDMDPVVERVIMRCLEHDPSDRPASAIAVAAALPGGDPLALALAAGETPSPEMVAQAGERGGLRPAVAASLLGAAVVFLALGVAAMDRTRIEHYVELLPPAVLEHRAQEIAASLGYSERPGDTDFYIDVDWAAVNWIAEHDEGPDPWTRAARARVDLMHGHYRSALRPMVPPSLDGRIGWNSPPFTEPGMVRIILGPGGTLSDFEAIPARSAGDRQAAPAPDFKPLLEAAGLSEQELEPAEPLLTPSSPFDAQAAWRWTGEGSERYPLRLEAASWRGRVVWFATVRPWGEPDAESQSSQAPPLAMVILFTALFLTVTVGGALLAMRNLKAGRGDRRGAFRLGLFFFLATLLAWVFQTDHVVNAAGVPIGPATRAFAAATSVAVVMWLLYLALEPFARRHWPRTLVSWTRMLSGRWRDPMVGRDLLIGGLTGVLFSLLGIGAQVLRPLVGLPPPRPGVLQGQSILSARHAVGTLADVFTDLNFSIGFFVLVLLLRIALRRTWLAVAAFIVIVAVFFGLLDETVYEFALNMVLVSIMLFVAVRFGLLALAAAFFAMGVTVHYPITFELAAWYAPTGLLGAAVVLALLGYGFWTALAGQPIFGAEGE